MSDVLAPRTMITTDLRPPYRMAMLVDAADADSVATAIRAATAIWGGWRCPLVPVTEVGDVADGDLELVRLLGCDEYFNLTAAGGG